MGAPLAATTGAVRRSLPWRDGDIAGAVGGRYCLQPPAGCQPSYRDAWPGPAASLLLAVVISAWCTVLTIDAGCMVGRAGRPSRPVQVGGLPLAVVISAWCAARAADAAAG